MRRPGPQMSSVAWATHNASRPGADPAAAAAAELGKPYRRRDDPAVRQLSSITGISIAKGLLSESLQAGGPKAHEGVVMVSAATAAATA